MTSIAQAYQQEALQQGMQQVARKMLDQLHLSIEKIQEVTGLSRKTLEQLAQ